MAVQNEPYSPSCGNRCSWKCNPVGWMWATNRRLHTPEELPSRISVAALNSTTTLLW
jgi:hypothetical protein